jgi:hypothetical protein
VASVLLLVAAGGPAWRGRLRLHQHRGAPQDRPRDLRGHASTPADTTLPACGWSARAAPRTCGRPTCGGWAPLAGRADHDDRMALAEGRPCLALRTRGRPRELLTPHRRGTRPETKMGQRGTRLVDATHRDRESRSCSGLLSTNRAKAASRARRARPPGEGFARPGERIGGPAQGHPEPQSPDGAALLRLLRTRLASMTASSAHAR